MMMETSTERELLNIVSQLIELYDYDEANGIITEKKSASLSKPIRTKTNFLCADLEKLSILSISNSESAEKVTLDQSSEEQPISPINAQKKNI